MGQTAKMMKVDQEALTAPGGEVERYLKGFIDERPFPPNLREAIAYGVMGGGKRLRPILVLRCCEAVGGEYEAALPAAGAIELIHCFSLVHDDLPAMDNDALRRGRPTLHIHAGEAMAILAGDAMSAMAFELLTTRVVDDALAARLVRELSVATNDMVAGQVFDTLPPADAPAEPMERLRNIHQHKTGALLRCACRMGAICGGADEAALARLTSYADAVGLMFQVVDDLLDVTSTAEQLGKATQKDEQAGKLTYPGLIGIDASRAEVQRLHEAALAAIEPLGEPARPLRDLADYMAVREK